MHLKGLSAVALLTVLVSGCGGGDPRVQAVSTAAASQECVNCHGKDLSPGTGARVVDEWRASTHNTANGAGCADCHEPASGHPNACDKCHGGEAALTGYEVTRNPDLNGKCRKCHGPDALSRYPNDVMMALAPQHFGNMTASTANTSYRASYVSSQYQGNCRKCHNPHNPGSALTVARQWAQSPHANVNAGAYKGDFKTRGTDRSAATTFEAYCVRCHTTTGYLNFVTSGFDDQHAWGDAADKTKEVTGCDACHDNGSGRAYSFKVRSVPPLTVYYNYSSSKSVPTVKVSGIPTTYPDLGASNVCMPCHAGRGIGPVITAAAANGLNFANANSPGAHNRAEAVTLYQRGYEFDGRSYANAAFQHGAIGIANLRSTGNKGPCVTCHMSGSSSHEFIPVTSDATQAVTGLTTTICSNCHDGAFQPAVSAASLQADKAGYGASLALLNILKTGKSTSTNWDKFSPGNGAKTMGASFNYSLLVNEPGCYAHNALYAKRLIYDSIDWIYNGAMDNDVVAAVNSAVLPAAITNPVTRVAYSAAEISQLKALAVEYLTTSGGVRP